ncbi:MAG: amidohydrolase family protein [Clostridiales bacterium]|nr:amidohydrolase family protein [Clostridiales bacterium]
MYVIQNGMLYTMEEQGVICADLRVEDGKIAEIGEKLSTEGAEVINAAGKCVTPGFIDAHSHVGGLMSMTDDDLNELTNPLTPELDAYYGINPNDKCFSVCIRQGITTSCLIPGSGNVVGGWGMAYKSAGEDRVIRRPAALKAAMGINPKGCYAPKNMTPMTRMAIANLLRTYLRNVKEYMEKKLEAAENPEKMPPYDLGLEHGIPVLEKKIPLKVHSYMHDMMTVLEIAKEFDILVTLDHAQGASDYYEELSDEHVQGVIFGPTCAPLFAGEGGKLDPECCKGLDDRGIPVAVMTDGPVTTVNMLVYEMGEAVRRGMDPVRALAMVTSNAAQILGIKERVGSLSVGKDADILIWSKLPSLATDAVLENVLIDGEMVLR